MKDTDFNKLLHFKNVGGALLPDNVKANELMLLIKKNDTIQLREVTKRDLSMHKCYMSLLSYIYSYMPTLFKKQVPERIFYKWLKHLRRNYEVQYSFIDTDKINDMLVTCLELGLTTEQSSVLASKFGKTDMIEYDSISFGNMSQVRFKEYVNDQLPFIYENVIGRVYGGEVYTNIIQSIEEAYERFMQKLI